MNGVDDDNNKIKNNFNLFRIEIEKCLLEKDICYFLEDLDDIIDHELMISITSCDKVNRVKNFLDVFDTLSDSCKYLKLQKSAEKRNKWIFEFLSAPNDAEKYKIRARWSVLENATSLLKNYKNTFEFNAEIINLLYRKSVISHANRDYLLAQMASEGIETALFTLFNVISMKDPDWYGYFLYAVVEQQSDFIDILPMDDLEETEENLENRCLSYARKFIDAHALQFEIENPIQNDFDKSFENEMENSFDNKSETDIDCRSDYGSFDGNEDYIEDSYNILDESEPESLELKKFQLELCEKALMGQNDIIYAPTGAGKTNMAVHITNEHLKKNPKGKVAFLVHRIPLVNQQYRLFQKYKSEDLKIVSLRGRSDNTSGPLIAHFDSNDIFVMTSEILRNALTIDDGNKIKSICEFSLIFFDECHNCMKGHPYVKIMTEYFNTKRNFPFKKLPQIVGLTASPRTNKKDNANGIKKSIIELCGNLDCLTISVVQNNKEELDEFLSQPQQNVILPKNRANDEFEIELQSLMVICEQKLIKMKNESYFPARSIRDIPTDKFREEYIGFIGNLERLNTVTVDECDGKQKAYTIYRYLRAYYKGLIANQIFNQTCAIHAIKTYLKHNGCDFSCSFDEEFYSSYRKKILNTQYRQSDNPSINEITNQISSQLKANDESRILIFVREKIFTTYLVGILKEMNIAAEAIVGSNSRTESKTCTDAEIVNILQRFSHGDTRVLVATTVVEEGLDVALCNMVISYGHVTNETAMIQRRGRVRAVDSKYILVLPPMLRWLEKKEKVNERRKDMMRDVVDQLQCIDLYEMRDAIENHQKINFVNQEKKPLTMIEEAEWKFTCKNCQTFISTSTNLRIIERAHRVCMDPEMLKTFKVIEEVRQSFGSQGNYVYAGRVLCNKCKNYALGNFIIYKKIPFFQLKIESCNSTNKYGKVESFKKWGQFAKFFTIADLNNSDFEEYMKSVEYTV